MEATFGATAGSPKISKYMACYSISVICVYFKDVFSTFGKLSAGGFMALFHCELYNSAVNKNG